jgi:hypothetical protein
MSGLKSSILSLVGDSLVGIIGAAAGAMIADRIARNGERKRNVYIAQSQLFPILDEISERVYIEDDMRRIRDQSVKLICDVFYRISPLLDKNTVDHLDAKIKDFKSMGLKTSNQILGGMVNDILDSGTSWGHLPAERELIKESLIQIKMSLRNH